MSRIPKGLCKLCGLPCNSKYGVCNRPGACRVAYKKAEYQAHKGRYLQYDYDYRRANPKSKMLTEAKRRAKERGIDFNLTADDINFPSYCPVLGTKLEVGGGPNSPSLDRIDPAKGYVKGNVQVMSMKANTMKNNASRDELLKFADWINTNYREDE